jgi:hypothetical protein
LREIRQELFGQHSGPELARRLCLPARTWYHYETGVTVPAEVLLRFLEQNGVSPTWLLTGQGPRYRHSPDDRRLSELTPIELIRRGLEELERSPREVVIGTPQNRPGDRASEFLAIPLYSLADLAGPVLSSAGIKGYVFGYRQWLPHPSETIGTVLTDTAMHPILPEDSIVAVDRAVTDPLQLDGRLVAACPAGMPMIRWLDVLSQHIILRSAHGGSDHHLIPIDLKEAGRRIILGQVIWSWSRFHSPERDGSAGRRSPFPPESAESRPVADR